MPLAATSRIRNLHANRVSDITFRCRDIGSGVEEGSILGYWTGEMDGWGKYTIRIIDVLEGESSDIITNPDSLIYLFADEIVSITP